MKKKELSKLFVLTLFLAGIAAFLLTDNLANSAVKAYSAGPPAGFTGAPGEFTCAECHVPESAGTGNISIVAPQSYLPGQTYQITVNHSNSDPTRRRWGFQLTALDDANQKAGNLVASADGRTQILDNQGPGSARQYVEHTASGTFIGQQFGASWIFDWTAPSTDVGPVTFYVAGNQANNDGNTSGDNIYFTFASVEAAATPPDFTLSVTPNQQTIIQGNSGTYNVTVTPAGGFTGPVDLTVSGAPNGTTAGLNPTTVNITDATPKSTTLTVNVTSAAALGLSFLNITATGGHTQHSTSCILIVTSPTSSELVTTQTVSPNPGQVGTSLAYRITIRNDGPATATGVHLTDTLPSIMTFVSATPDKGTCSGTSTINCDIGSVSVNESVVVTIVVTPTTTGQPTNTANVTGNETEPNTFNNHASVMVLIEPQLLAPSLFDPNLSVRTLTSGLDQPVSIAFISSNDLLVTEKATGKVQRVVNGQLHSTALDLAVNNSSERGLLGLALHPAFNSNGFVYLYWTESSTGADTSDTAAVPLLGNRVDRYVWNGSTLVFDRNLIHLRAYQEDVGQPLRANHNGGVLRFGPDGKLYIIMGDNGRRGLLQNITTGGPVPDDQYGGPEPDNAHLTGVVLRLNDDGSTPTDNPFFSVSSGLSGEAAANI
ncbi:MAG: hypothetical protein QOF02_1093, partial [Blastocatellia bacterium]|nr:hypothetical protein [Blastocatellia bacterium]